MSAVWTVLSVVCGVVLFALLAFVFWLRWMFGGLAKIARDPHNEPKLGWRDEPPAKLSTPNIEKAVARLESLGFTELGTKVEKIGMRSIPNRVFTHPDGTIAGVMAIRDTPHVSFLSAFKGEITLVYTGIDRKTKRHGSLIEAGMDADIDTKLAAHQALIRDVESVHGPLRAVTCDTPERRLELTREYYVQRYTNEGTYFQPFQNPVRLKLP